MSFPGITEAFPGWIRGSTLQFQLQFQLRFQLILLIYPINNHHQLLTNIHLNLPLASATLLLLSLTPSSAWIIRTFSGPGCTGSAREIKVDNNSCRTNDIPATRSFRVLTYGGPHQKAEFHDGNNCWRSTVEASWWADGGSDDFIKNRCLDLHFQPKVFGSFAL
ncbi:hypothetical protein BJX70DRAFT_393279 [Aspergillus crustosus]